MKNNNQSNGSQEKEKDESFSIKDFVKACASHWRWFLLSVLFFTFVGVVYVVRQQPRFSRTMQVLIKDQNGGGGIADIAGSFSQLGLVSTNTNVYNELISLKSPAVMYEVVKSLNLDTDYRKKGFPKSKTLYGTNLPFLVSFEELPSYEGGSFSIEINPDGTAQMKKFKHADAEGIEKFDDVVNLKKGYSEVKTPLGKIKFEENPRYAGGAYDEPVEIVVSRQPFLVAVERYSAMLKGDLADRDADVIDLSIIDVSIERADDILNKVLDVYTSKYVADKNRMAIATSQFIDDRLNVIQEELGVVDSDIMKYKSETLIPDLQEAAKMNMKSTHDIDEQLLEASTELAIAQYMEEFVNNPSNKNSVIPVNTGVLSNQLEVQISNYNNLLLNRNSVAESSSASNPLVKDYDKQLEGLHEAIKRALHTQVVTVGQRISKLQGAQDGIKGQLASAPTQAKHLLTVERQQKVKEELYLFLLQKREENELTQTFTADNTRVITPPMGPLGPVAPKTKMTVGLAFLLGLLFPAMIIYLQESSNTKVRSRKDLERMSTPFIGEIPFVGKKNNLEKLRVLFGAKKKKLEQVGSRVSRGSRDLVNESFRIVRGNIDFMLSSSCGRVMMITSFNPGSGKSFVTYNLATSFAIKGKKVLIIDCDLRHGSASQFVGMPPKGITSYLNGHTEDWRNLLISDEVEADLQVLPIGHRPPNPAELLESPKMKKLVEEAKSEYDYVFLDCPPVDVVVDTQVLSPLADNTIFIVRAGLLEKSAVPEIDALYKELRFKQMSIILNGTEQKFSRYGSDGRGYYGSSYAVHE